MKFTVNKSDITEAVSNIQRAVSTKTSIPALEGILIGASEEGLELCAYDLELGITTVIPAFVVEPGKAVLSAAPRRRLSLSPWMKRTWPP